MYILYFDCPAGAAGDMILAALLDCGLSLEELQDKLSLLPLDGYSINTRRVHKSGISARQVEIVVHEKQPPRHLPEIMEIINGAPLSAAVRQKSGAAFKALARAEARVHGVTEEQVHFHEVGALDSILDIVGTFVALEMLGIKKARASPLPLGKGWINIAHGRIPLPAPAAMEIIKEKGIPCYGVPLEGETVTPTGAALLGTICDGFSPLPGMVIKKTGYGAGKRELPYPNIIRVFAGAPYSSRNAGNSAAEQNAGEALHTEPLEILEANIDDLNPEIYDHLLELLFSAGAKDVYFTAVQMKKNRPAVKVTILGAPSDAHHLGRILMRETTTLGYRRLLGEKIMLARKQVQVQTPWGPVRVKVAGQSPPYSNIAPEYGDCRRIAVENNIPLKKVYQAVLNLAEKELL